MTEPVSLDQSTAGTSETGSGALPGVGARLRLAREMRQMTVDDVALALRLGPRQVDALEKGNWQGLPGQTFIRGFVRNYARVLQIDPAPLMDQLDDTLGEPADSLNVPVGRPTAMPSGQHRRNRPLIVAGLVFVALAVLAYAQLPNDLSALRERVQGLIDSVSRKEPAPAAGSPAAPAASGEPVFPPGSTQQQVMNPQARAPAEMAPAPLAGPGAARVENAPLRFVFASDSWVEVRDRDDNVVFAQFGAAGSERTVGGPGPLSVVIGNAPGVKLIWRGKTVDLAPHTKGEAARLVLE